MKKIFFVLCGLMLMGTFTARVDASVGAKRAKAKKPNIILILADDLGYRELGCYGQKIIKTPNLDQLAKEGMRFTNFYSGSTVCAPARCTLLTGKHTGHSYIRGNREMGGWGPDEPEGQEPLPKGTQTIATLLKAQGYATGAIGKWGLGGPGSTGRPNKQGFDFFYGYLCQRVAHNYYPTHLWKNDKKDMLNNDYFRAHQRLKVAPANNGAFDKYKGRTYAPDRMAEEAEKFIRRHKDEPFFLYVPTPIPHVSIQVPDDSLKDYRGKLDTKPYLGEKGYLPHAEPHAGYAAMITRMDRDMGRLFKLLKELKLDDNTIVIFTSDNGTTFNGGCDRKFFDSLGKLRGHKCNLYEGGIRVPMIVKWPGKIKPNTTSDHISALWDFLPTLGDMVGYQSKEKIDGISLLPTLIDQGEQVQHQYLYWQYGSSMAVRYGDWKGVKSNAKRNANGPIQLYNLKQDPSESKNVAMNHPEIVAKIQKFMEHRVNSKIGSWNFPRRNQSKK